MLRHFVSFGSATIISRLLGFCRDILTAALLGTGFAADAYVVAFRFPNLFRRLFAEGGFAASFVPLFSTTLVKNGQAEAVKFAEQIMVRLVIILLILTAIAEITMPFWLLVIAPGFFDDSVKIDLTILLTRITFPYLLFMALVALLSGILNSFNHFFIAAITPALLNLVLITVLLLCIFFDVTSDSQIATALAWGVSFAGFIQMLTVFIAVRRLQLKVGLRLPRRTERISRFWHRAIPGTITGGIAQINIIIGTMIASNESGAASILYYADRVYQLPLAIIGIALGVIILPELSALLQKKSFNAALVRQNDAFVLAWLLVIPASIGIFIFAEAIITVFFKRGAFDYDNVLWAAAALRGFVIGLPAFVLIRILSSAFFSRGDTKTPMFFAAISVITNVTFSLILFQFMGAVGIAVATSIAGWVNVILLFISLASTKNWLFDLGFMRNVGLILLSSIITGLLMLLINDFLSSFWQLDSLLYISAVLFGAVLFSVIFYFSLIYIMGLRIITTIPKLISGKSGKR